MFSSLLYLAVTSAALAASAAEKSDNSPECETIERTVMVPTWVTETRKVQETQYREEQRERQVTYYVKVPKTETRT